MAEPTERVAARVPVSVADRALRAAERSQPGITRSGVVRLALARLAGLANADDYGRALPVGPRTGNRDTAT
jgi:hypothetical protein